MSVEQNKEVTRKTIDEVWNKGAVDLIPELFNSDYIARGVAGPDIKGHDGWRQVVLNYRKAFPDVHDTIDELIAEGDKVVCRHTMTGTHTGEYPGLAPTGKKTKTTTIFVNYFKNGKIAETWSISNPIVFYSQLGMAPPGYEIAKK